MNLSREQFDVLEVLATKNVELSHRDLEALTGQSLYTVGPVTL